MAGKLREHLTYANVVATIGLLIAVGLGSAWAASLSKNSVGPKQISKNAVKAPEIAKNAVRSAEVRAGAVGTEEVSDASLLSEDFAQGQLPAGPPGVAGQPGEPGQDATKLFGYIADDELAMNPTAVVLYGSGVTGVDDFSPSHDYSVSFNRSLVNCVVHAVAGRGNPGGGAITQEFAFPRVSMGPEDDEVAVEFRTNAGSFVDTSFMITAFC